MIENYNLPNKKYRDSLGFKTSLLRQTSIESETSLKRMNLLQFQKKKSTLRSTRSNQFCDKQSIKTDTINQRDSSIRQSSSEEDNLQHIQLIKIQPPKPKSKGVRFRDRISIESIDPKDCNPLFNISDQEKISMLHNIVKNKNFNLPMTSRRKTSQTIKIVTDLMNSPVQSKSNVIEQLRCFMCHYPEHNSQLFSKKTILAGKQKLKNLAEQQAQEGLFFRYELFGYFLKNLSDMNYDSLETVNSFEMMLHKYNYPTPIKIMFYYMGSHLYQVNNLYEKSQQILGRLLGQLMKFKMFEFVGVYFFLMAKLKANLLQWESCISYLMKLLAYTWLHHMDNLQIWIYFQLSRSYFFLNQQQNSEYFKIRSQMSIIQPTSSIYRQLVAKDFKNQLQQIRAQNRTLNLTKIISIAELTKLKDPQQTYNKEKDSFKLQSQIKSINQSCKIKHVKNLIHRMNSSQLQAAKSTRYLSSQDKSYYASKSTRHLAGNPLLRTHQSGLKNLKIYFRNNPKGQSLLNKNRQPKLYTFENSNKNILVLKQLSRNILLEMKWFLPINQN